MSRLALYLLGPPRVERARPDGGEAEAVRISRTKVVALLAYLAVTAQPHRRDALVALLSPELDTTRAARELRRSLYELNRVLGPGYLAANREIVHLHITTGPSSTPLAHREISPTGSERALWIDVAQFRQLLAVCETHGHPTYEACADCVPSLNDAVQLYSDHFLAGFTLPDSLAFEEWQFFQAEELCQALGSALQRLVRWYSAQGEQTYERAIGYARRWLALDPLHEPAHRQLMALYAQSGHPAAALRQYRVCLRTLEEELGVPPAAETTALYERIRAERAVAAPSPVPRPAVPAAVPAFLGEEAPRAIVPKPVFVARERELARLGTHLEAALTGRGQVAFVTGGPGRGKTALMEAFARKAMEAHPDLLVAMGRCNAYSGVGDPYLPFRDVLGMLTGDVEGRWAAGTISAEHARRLWNTLPEAVRALLDYGPHLIETFVPAAALLPRAEAASHAIGAKTLQELRVWLDRRRSSASGLDQARIFQQVADTLAALSSSKPLLLILDDLQWTDTASASLLFHLGRRLADAGGRILILGAYRPEEVALDRPSARFAQHPERDERTGERERHPMQKVLSEFRRHYGEMWLDLTTADQVEGRAFVDAYLDSPASPWASNRLEDEFRAALTERTDGHALFTIELLRGMHERGGLTQDVEGVWITGPALDWERLPARVEAVIQERI
jgi:DNA-binding SARP family transcriptional activator